MDREIDQGDPQSRVSDSPGFFTRNEEGHQDSADGRVPKNRKPKITAETISE